MRYCVIKDTIRAIDGSDNSNEIMLQNALSAGFAESEVEILIEEEYRARKELEPNQPTPPPTELELLRLEQAQANTELIQLIIAMTGGSV